MAVAGIFSEAPGSECARKLGLRAEPGLLGASKDGLLVDAAPYRPPAQVLPTPMMVGTEVIPVAHVANVIVN
jgi:hypothetical protein